jgi:signal transduction histidine kinase/ligand-binding sensor domain-containing protein/DNA-binding response OmpR family regulator
MAAQAQLYFEHIGTQQGLSQSSVEHLCQDRRNFMWLATADGLNRYDGYSFFVYRHLPADSLSLSSSHISYIFEQKNTTLWIGTRNAGLNRMHPDGKGFERFATTSNGFSISNAEITAMTEDRQGRIWVATRGHGLLCVESTGTKGNTEPHFRISRYSVSSGHLPSDSVTAIATARQGVIWLGFAGGQLLTLHTDSGQFHLHPNLPDRQPGRKDVNLILEDQLGQIWLGYQRKGLYVYHPADKRYELVSYDPQQEAGINFITSGATDRDGSLWVGTDNGLLLVDITNRSVKHHIGPDRYHEGGLKTHAVKAVFADRSNNLWVGTWQSGLHVRFWHRPAFQYLRHIPNQYQAPLDDKVTALTTWKNQVWIGSNYGMSLYENGVYTHFTEAQNLPSTLLKADITRIYAHPEGYIYASVWNGGFLVKAPGNNTFRHIQMPNRLGAMAINRASGRRVWVSAEERGLYLFDPQSGILERPLSDALLQQQNITSLLQDRDSILWLGTSQNGVFAVDLKTMRFTQFRAGEQGLSSSYINCIAESADGRILIGTQSGGLNIFNKSRGQFTALTSKEGLPSNVVNSIVPYASDIVWLSTNNGLSQLHLDNFKVDNYGMPQGLKETEYSLHAGSLDASGKLFFGSMRGVVCFKPAELTRNPEPPQVYITGLRLFNKLVQPNTDDAPILKAMIDTREITLRHNQSVVTFEFTALSYQRAYNNAYAYIMEGMDPDWNYVGSQQSATYTNLKPGTYTFRVKASNSDNVWNDQGTSLSITVLPPWHQTYWAYLAYAGIVVLIYRWLKYLANLRARFKSDLHIKNMEAMRVQELDRLKTSFFTNISHELRTPLTLIISPLEKMLDGAEHLPAQVSQHLKLMHRNALRLLQLINQLLDLSKIEADNMQPEMVRGDLEWFVGKIVAAFEELASEKQVDLRCSIQGNMQMLVFAPDIIEKVLFNLISNALKFTDAGGIVQVSLQYEAASSERVRLTVQDTGIGIGGEHQAHIFDRFYRVEDGGRLKTTGTGIGLALSKELIELHKGSIQVESQPGKGSTFIVILPVHEKYFPTEWMHDKSIEVSAQHPYIPAMEKTEHNTAASGAGRQAVVLIAEDNPDMADYLERNFAPLYKTIVCNNGAEAFQKALSIVPDVIVSDLIMPHTDGIAFCRQLREHPATNHIPFILLTSRSGSESELLGINSGADDYITKPFNFNVLHSRLQNLIRMRAQLRERYTKQINLQPSEITVVDNEEAFLRKAMEAVEANMANPDFSIEMLEQELSFSKMQLYRKLKALVGMSGNEFIRHIRLKRAAQILSASDQTIAEVAYEVGFNDPAYFTRCFRKEFGCAPSEYAALQANPQ